MSGHAVLAPSFAYAWGQCPAAATMALQCPEEESQAARDGTAAHWVAATRLRGTGEDCYALLDNCDPDGTQITAEICDAVDVYVNDINTHVLRAGSRHALLVEYPIRATRIHQEVWGTLDAAWFDGKRLIVWDFKYGHKLVSPIWNPQLICYAAGLLDFYGVDGVADQQITVEFRIVQPRCFSGTGPVSTFSFVASDLRGRVNQLATAAQLAWSGKGNTLPGPYCAHCPGRAQCPAQRDVSLLGADFAHQPIAEILPASGLSFELAVLDWLLPQLEARREALAADAMARIIKGDFVPGYSVVRPAGRRKFDIPDADVIEFGRALGVELRKPTSVVTVSEAERRIKAIGLDPDMMLVGVVATPLSDPKLKQTNNSDVVRIFSTTPQN